VERAAWTFFLAAALALIACVPAGAATITEFTITTGGSHTPRFLTTGPDGAIWFTDGGSPGGIGSISTDGNAQGLPFSGAATFDIAASSDGSTYWSSPETGRVSRRRPSGQIDQVIASGENAVAIDASNVAQFGTTGNSSAFPGEYETDLCDHNWTTSGRGCASIDDGFPSPVRVTGLALAPDGAMWAAEYEGDRVVRVLGTGPRMKVQLPPGAHPYRLGVGPDGNIWVPEYGIDKIARVTASGLVQQFPLPALSGPNDIVTGPDGNLWFPEFRSSKIGCLTPAGKVSEYPIPTHTAPWGITNGPDGNIWFTESNVSKIGRLKIDSTCGADASVVNPGAGSSGAGSSDTTAPSFTKKLALSPSKFRVAPGSTAVSARKRKVPRGSKFKYGLSEPATVTIAIQRPTVGRKVGGKCKKKTRGNRKRRKCIFYKTVGTLTRKAAQGSDANAFTGRIGSRKLKRGKYRAAATAKDAAGNSSVPSNAPFTIVR
jgi:streptogramin lyase